MRTHLALAALVTLSIAAAAGGAAQAQTSAAGCYRPPQAPPAGSKLTPERVKFEVATMFDAAYRDPFIKKEAICYVFESMQILPVRARKLGAGAYDPQVQVTPVRMTVRVRIDRGKNGLHERVRGYGNENTPKETFYFYLEDGDWAFKTGNP